MTMHYKSPAILATEIKRTEAMAQLIKQPYPITMSKHRLNVYEMRIMMRIVDTLQPLIFESQQLGNGNKLKGKEEVFFSEDFKADFKVKEFLPEGDRNHERVRVALESLTKKDVKIPCFGSNGKLKGEVFTNIIKEGKYTFKEEDVHVEISKYLLPEFVALSHGFTQFSLEVAFNCSSPYAMRLYQLASQWRGSNPFFEISISDVREMFKIENKYKEPNSVVRWILNPAIKELKEKADVWPDLVGVRKDGRRVIGWKFKVHKRKGIEKSEKAKAIETVSDKKREVPAGLVEGRKKAEVLWAKCLTALKKEITFDQFETWIIPIKPEGIDQNTLKLGVPNAFFAEKIEEVFLTKIMKNIDEFNVALIHLDRKKEVEDREVEKKKEEEAFLEKLQKTYGLSEKQAYKVEFAMEANSSNRKKVIAVLKEIDAAKRDGKIRSSIGGATASKLQIQLGIKLY